jgi:competence protein ComEC
LLLFGFFCLGLLSSSLEKYPLAADQLQHLVKHKPEIFQGDGMDLSGTITAPVERSSRGSLILLSDVCFLSVQGPLHTRGKLRLFLPHPNEGDEIFYRPGDRLKTFAKLRIPRNFANPGAFDYVSYLARDGIHLVGSVKTTKLLTLEKGKNWKWGALMAELRQRVTSLVQKRFSKHKVDKKIANFLLAITIGNREGFSQEDKKLLSRGGIYHIVAISGLHVGIIAWFSFWSLSFLKCPDRWASLITVMLLLAYLPLSGGRCSAIRAVLMATLYLFSRIIHRRSNILTAIALSAFLLLLLKPKFLFDPGFQLTYAATLSIISFSPMLSRFILWGNILRSLMLLSLSAQIGVIPILAYHFNSILWISLLTNAVILPLLLLILPLSFALEVTLFFHGFLSQFIAPPLTILIKLIFSIASVYDDLPFLSYRIPSPPFWLIILYYLSAWAWRYSREKRFKIMSFGLLLLFLVLIATYPFPPERKEFFESTFIDVGQGESAFLVSQDGTSILIDGGGRWGERFDAGEMVVSKFLWHQGHKNINILVLSHLHADHAGGVPSILENFHVGKIILSESERSETLFSEIKRISLKRGTPIHFVDEELITNFDHFTLELFQHNSQNGHLVKGNERSLIVKVTCGQVRFLFMGDAPSSSETAIIESGRDLRSSILKIAHHGSSDASSQNFLEAVQPETCIISCGADNRWGHPMPQVLERIARIGAELYRTDENGAITIQADRTSYRTETCIKESPVLLRYKEP